MQQATHPVLTSRALSKQPMLLEAAAMQVSWVGWFVGWGQIGQGLLLLQLRSGLPEVWTGPCPHLSFLGSHHYHHQYRPINHHQDHPHHSNRRLPHTAGG